MPILRVRFNYSFRELDNQPHWDKVEVYLKNGETQSHLWLGFIDLEKARKMKHAIAVKLMVTQYSNDEIRMGWISVPNGEYVQGCLTDQGVYGVTQTTVRLVSPPKALSNSSV